MIATPEMCIESKNINLYRILI